MLVFEVPHFSSNTVTFSGEVSIESNPATNGSSYQYTLNSVDSVSDPVVNLTGEPSTEWDNVTESGIKDGDSISISVAGNADPTGPSSNNNPTVTVTGTALEDFEDGDVSIQSTKWSGWSGDTTNLTAQSSLTLSGDVSGKLSEGNLDGVTATRDNEAKIDKVSVEFKSNNQTGEEFETVGGLLLKDSNGNYISSVRFRADGDIETAWSGTDIGTWETGTSYEVEITPDYANSQFDVSINDGAITASNLDTEGGSGVKNLSLINRLSGTEAYFDDITTKPTENPSVDVDNDGTDDVTINGTLQPGESQTKEVDLSAGDDTAQVSMGSGTADFEFHLKERTLTTDPAVELNGESVSYSGTLSDGETTSLSLNESALTTGQNQVNVSVGDGSLSTDAPAPVVGLDYRHSATDKQSVNYTGEKWSESYNVSRSYATDRASASLTIPFAGDVAGITDVEKSVNGGSWSTVSQDSYSLNQTTLTVDLGSVSGGDSVAVRATGRRVNVINGSITVTDPTVMGDRLDTKFRIDSWSDSAFISLANTPDSSRLNYVYDSSWDSSESYMRFTASGYRFLHMPVASVGDEARISTIPVRPEPASGDVVVSVDEPRTQEPQFTVRSGEIEDDSVSFTYLNAQDETHYVLKSKTNGIVVDDGTANSPLTLEDDDSAETLVFLVDEEVASSSEQDGPIGGPIEVDDSSPLSSPTVVVLAWGLLTAGFYVVQRRIGGPDGFRIPLVGSITFPGGVITLLGSLGSGVLIIEIFSGRISKALAGVISSIGPIAGIAAVGIAVWWAYNQIRGRPVVINQ
jgi:hypothetical protein